MSEEESTITHHHHDHHDDHDSSSSSSNQRSSYPSAIEESTVIHHHHESNQPSSFDFPNKNDESGVVIHHHRDTEQPPPPPPPVVVVPHYGTFEGLPSSPSIGFPQPMLPTQYYDHRYQAVPGYAVADGTPLGVHDRLPCCGLGYGWLLFIIGFFMAGVPWYAAAIIFLCCRDAYVDPREKPAYVCCMIFAVLGIITTIFGMMSYND